MNRRLASLVILLTLVLTVGCHAAEKLKDGDVLAVCGDSITEQKEYSVFIQDYLLMCRPAANLRAHQFGWGGETSWGFRARMNAEVLPFGPTAATTCYGMNDGGYAPMTPQKAQAYRDAQKTIVQNFKKAGLRLIVVGAPGCVDADTYRNNPEQAAMYNKTLSELRDIARSVAEEEGVNFANVHDAMVEAMTQAKAKHGKAYHVGGGDGVHPSRNGQLVMAYAFLKALGCDGDIGTITVELPADKAAATGGHRVLSCQKGVVEVESTRYPFCFYGDPASTSATRGVIEFIPFNDELNRFQLVVKGGDAPRYKVTWWGEGSKKAAGADGGAAAQPQKSSKVFAAADLAKGINLAAEFLDNPFYEPFQNVERAVRAQQNLETPLVKSLMHNLPQFKDIVPEEKDALDRVQAGGVKRSKALLEAAVQSVKPVKHTLTIEPVTAATEAAQ